MKAIMKIFGYYRKAENENKWRHGAGGSAMAAYNRKRTKTAKRGLAAINRRRGQPSMAKIMAARNSTRWRRGRENGIESSVVAAKRNNAKKIWRKAIWPENEGWRQRKKEEHLAISYNKLVKENAKTNSCESIENEMASETSAGIWRIAKKMKE